MTSGRYPRSAKWCIHSQVGWFLHVYILLHLRTKQWLISRILFVFKTSTIYPYKFQTRKSPSYPGGVAWVVRTLAYQVWDPEFKTQCLTHTEKRNKITIIQSVMQEILKCLSQLIWYRKNIPQRKQREKARHSATFSRDSTFRRLHTC
jgi:hypothetical protein